MPDDTHSRDHEKFIIRMPPGMRDRIAAAAKKGGRSMNAEIVRTLDFAYPDLNDLHEIKRQLKEIAESVKERGWVGEHTNDLRRILNDLRNSESLKGIGKKD